MSSSSDLCDAILANAPLTVQRCLRNGVGPNTPLLVSRFKTEPGNGAKVSSLDYHHGGHIFPIHAALRNCYDNYSENHNESSSVEILKLLIRHGANLKATAQFSCCNFNGLNNVELGRSLDAEGFAVFLKSYANTKLRIERCNEILKLLDSHLCANATSDINLDVVAVPKSVHGMWKGLLLSPKYSDVRFVCADKVVLPAHRNVLATASPYFDTAFQGPWAENNEGGEWATSVPSDIMKAALTFIYTGSTPKAIEEAADQNPGDLLAIASEYELRDLKSFSESILICNIDIGNVKKRLQLAHLHGCDALKKACFDFVRDNSFKVLTDDDFNSLKTEDGDLWEEMVDNIDGNRKRKRDG